ncbi:aspartyl-phosphate phosphatase Spo0E family protein [Clostridium botulinum]|nr:aspartyl-phosphate phosphatase Spo0E family protein [Clostridium botulinum]EES49613.1 conserved domain protein [Clostridium botulinum E1 str. 'BoNT E Beluga']MBY6759693.1 aspartyl-phosphate phosphatase Spo0E family protein [Clostridium botulinum]MBY6918601.1 aspartyl-phosphate phosphatase Spo0E family protein [Clostridium botulinum]MBY6988585.1 aspartyl-phosphate phosphatase Spo0E family protein [Clostridium botulinum]MCR1129684.1 aspartyl-phosphate phosphatase Spo0E family protein [Clostri
MEKLLEDLSKGMEELREKLIKSIENNGILAPITIKLSQQLDKLIVAEMKRVKI